jgi:conjugal transfer ATP-binding protein TraC
MVRWWRLRRVRDEASRSRVQAGVAGCAALIAPEALRVTPDRVDLGSAVARTLVVVGYPRQVAPGWLDGLYGFPAELRVAAFVEPVGVAEAVADLTRRMQHLRAQLIRADRLGAERDAAVEAALQDAASLRDALVRGASKLFLYHLFVTLFAADGRQLESLTRLVERELEGRLLVCRRGYLEQEPAFRSTLPLGRLHLAAGRNMDSQALATTLPFIAGEMVHPQGEVWGVHRRHHSLVLLDRFRFLNPHTVTVAASGAGKSYWLKSVLTQAVLRGIRAVVIDPSGEYRRWAEALGGRYVRLGPGSPHGVNPLELTPGDRWTGGDADPREAVARKADFVKALCEVMAGQLSPGERALLDELLLELYGLGRPDGDPEGPGASRPAPGTAEAPTFAGLVALLERSEPGRTLAARLRPVVLGSTPLFAGTSPVPMDAPLLVFDVAPVVSGERALAPAAYFVLAEQVVRLARATGQRAFVAVDEAHFLLRHPAAARFLEELYRTGRKLGVGISLLTQSVSDVLADGSGEAGRAAEACLANAALALLMRQQNAREVERLSRVFRLSRSEAEFLLACGRGEGLVVAGSHRAAIRVEVPGRLHPLFAADPP